MSELKQKTCEACRVGAPLATDEEVIEWMQEIPDWEVIEVEKVRRLQRQYKFKDFVAAMDFANKVGQISEEENHHPAIVVEWGKVTVIWWTHKIKGLHQNDFIMAAKTDQLI